MRRLGPGDEARLDAFLTRHWASSMFLRSNVAAHGLSGEGHRHATTVWATEDGTSITGVIGCTQAGLLLVQAPQADPAFWEAGRQALTGQKVLGGTGLPDQIDALCNALGLARQGYGKASDEPLMSLDLARLIPHKGQGQMRPGQSDDLAWLAPWFQAFGAETGLNDAVANDPADLARRFIEEGKGRLVIQDGQPVAMTNFNARLPDCVQLGGVYTPPQHRRRGYAAEVITLHLQEAMAQGVTRAILFAASKGAKALYASLGFRTIGQYAMRLLSEPQVVT